MDMRGKIIEALNSVRGSQESVAAAIDDFEEVDGHDNHRVSIDADAIIAALPDMVQDLEWTPAKWCSQTFYTANDLYRVIKADSEALWCVTYATVPLRHTNGLTRWFDTIEGAQAAANAHHRAQVMKAFGLEVPRNPTALQSPEATETTCGGPHDSHT